MRCYSHLSDDEREQIGLAKALGHSIGAIAQAIGRPKSTISRELSRNKLPSGRYSPLHAAGAYQLRRRREALIERDRALRTFVVDRLAEGWTPEQISGWLKGGNERRLRAVSCETIYAFIYRAAQRAEQLWRYLTRRHKRRRPRRSRPSQDTIKDRVSIHERPKTVDGRTEGGHWEGDLIICKRTRPVLVLHERKSRVTLAARLAGKTAAETISVMLAVFARIEPTLRKSITFDNDTAFAQHDTDLQISPRSQMSVMRRIADLSQTYGDLRVGRRAAEGEDLFSEARRILVALLFLRRSPRVTTAQGSSQGAHCAISFDRLLINR